MSYVVGSKLKELLKSEGLMTAGDFAAAVSNEVASLVRKAGSRAKANGRKTVRATDL